MYDDDLITICVPGDPRDPRDVPDPIPGVRIIVSPSLHPDDLLIVDGLPCTSISRTLIDLADVVDEVELRATFARAHRKGLLDRDALLAARSRVEWRPSLEMLDRVIADWT